MQARHAIHGRQIGRLGGSFHQGISLGLIPPGVIKLGQHVHALGISRSIHDTAQKPVRFISIQFPALAVLKQFRRLQGRGSIADGGGLPVQS